MDIEAEIAKLRERTRDAQANLTAKQERIKQARTLEELRQLTNATKHTKPTTHAPACKE